MVDQLDLEDFVRWRHGDATTALVEACREVTAVHGLKVMASKLGTSDSVLSHALSGSGRHPMRMEWIEPFTLSATNDRIPEVIARLRRRGLVPLEEMTPEEELARLKQAMAETLGPEVRQIIQAKVRVPR